MRFSLYPVLVAATLSALLWDYFFIPPIFTFSIGSKEDALLLLMYFVVALLSGVFNYKIRQFEQIARQKEEREMSIKLYNTLFDSLSHELRTPIATILGATDALQENEDKLSKENKRELAVEITNAALRLNNQLENLLNTSRLESGFIRPNLEWCDVNELIYNVLNKMQAKLAAHEVHVEIEDNSPLVKLDFGLMEQVLNNVIGNAAHYTPPKTQISIQAFVAKSHEGYVLEDEDALHDTPKYKLVIKIADNGKGISEAEIPFIFNKFYRLKKTQLSGTGLGLFIVKGFVEAQGGSIKAFNNVPNGALFIIEIPTTVLTQTIHHG